MTGLAKNVFVGQRPTGMHIVCVEDPPKSILFRIPFEIRLRSLSREEESSLLRMACACGLTMTIASVVQRRVVCTTQR